MSGENGKTAAELQPHTHLEKAMMSYGRAVSRLWFVIAPAIVATLIVFNIGWTQGHGGMTWTTLVHADDEDKLNMVFANGYRILRQYLYEAPESAKIRYKDPFFERYHLGGVGPHYNAPQYYEARGYTKVDRKEANVPKMMKGGEADYYYEQKRWEKR